MEISRKHQNVIIWTVVVILVLSIAYWYAARPYVAATGCHHIALDSTGYIADEWRSWAGNNKNQIDYMFIYELCMHKEGINP